MQLFNADAIVFSNKSLIFFVTPKNWKNGPQKLLIIGPDLFFPQSSPGHSPQPRIDFSYYEISGPDSCYLIYESHPQLYPLVAILKPLLTVYQHENYGCIFRSVEISSCVHRNSASFLMHLECMGYICLHNFMRLFFPKKYAWNQDLVSCISQALEVLYG